MNEPPVRLCCGERHNGPQCLDGKVMCIICFERKEVSELSTVFGKPCDVCRECDTRQSEANNE